MRVVYVKQGSTNTGPYPHPRFLPVPKEHPLSSLCAKCIKMKPLHTCGTCTTCCRCVFCIKCQKVQVQDLCTVCLSCPGCCQCYLCRSCNQIHYSLDTLCQYCGLGTLTSCGCCQHGKKTTKVETLFRRVPVNLLRYEAILATDLVLNPLTRLLSAEIELCGFNKAITNLAAALKGWHASCVSDGSLPSGGCELNTHPASGDFWSLQVNEVMRAVHDAEGWVNEQAGCHIHVDARNCGYKEMAGVMMLICALEESMFDMIPPARRMNHFCVRSGQAYLDCFNTMIKSGTAKYRETLLGALYNRTDTTYITDVKRKKQNNARYRAINLHSFIFRGTLEFRMPAGTIHPENIIMWGRFLGTLVEYGATHSFEHIKELVQVRTGALEVLDTHVVTQRGILTHIFGAQSPILDWVKGRWKWAGTMSTTSQFLEESPKQGV